MTTALENHARKVGVQGFRLRVDQIERRACWPGLLDGRHYCVGDEDRRAPCTSVVH